MFDFGFDKITEIISNNSENAFNDLISKLKPTKN
jgi:hypothetical protein